MNTNDSPSTPMKCSQLLAGLLPKIVALQEATSPGFADARDVFGASMSINSNKERKRL
jgi:hypothetical protein